MPIAPGPPLAELARRLFAIRDDPIAFLDDLTARYGDLVALPVPRSTVLLVNDPAAVRQVLQTRAAGWSKHTVQYAALATVTGPGLLAATDDGWLERRRAAQPAFHHGRLDRIGDASRTAARAATGSWDVSLARDSAPYLDVDVPDLAGRLTLQVVGRTLFDADLAGHAEDLVLATGAAAELVVAEGRGVPWPPSVPTRLRRRRAEAVRTLDRVVADLIGRRRARGVAPDDEDLLGVLLRTGWDDRSVRDELVTMVVAGHETVASALGWTLMLLAGARAAQDRVAGETDPERPWTRAVVQEALRLYPPGWVLSRRASAPGDVGGVCVPAGTIALVSPWVLHRRAGLWPDPLAFVPERFLRGADGDASAAARRTAYLPFGWGPRQCVGRDFALVELVTVLGELLRGHEVTLPPGFVRPRLDAFVTLRPRGGLVLRVSCRSLTGPR